MVADARAVDVRGKLEELFGLTLAHQLTTLLVILQQVIL